MGNAKNLLDFISNADFFRKITTPVKASPGELILMILKFSNTYTLSFTAIRNLISLINNIFDVPILPESRYLIEKMINFQDIAHYHVICPNCFNYLGKSQEIGKALQCNACDSSVNISRVSVSNHFVILDPSTEISNLIQSHENYYNYVVSLRSNETREIKDIYDGHSYKSFKNCLPPDEKNRYVTAIFNTDGAPRFESSQNSIWPIQIQINELPPQSRLNNTITCGIWFGKNKPNMITFLDIFVKEMNAINKNGIECIVNGEKRKLKLYMLVSCVDAVARAPMQGLVQFNGYNSCSWCLHRGEWYDGCVRFPILNYRPADRQVSSTVKYGKQAIKERTTIMGVKYVTPLIDLPCFNIIDGFVPDYLHCYLAGVVKQITECILKLLKKNDIEKINYSLLKIQVPNQLSRLTRSLEDRSHWKAKEWENWLLYYSIPLLQTIVNDEILQHWFLLVNSLHGLLKTSLSIDELDQIDESLHKFVLGVERLYGKRCLTYNVHQLLHIARSVYNWGPLWAHSTFPFESGNNKLLKAIHSAKGVNEQIVRYINISYCISILERVICCSLSEATKRFCQDLITVRVKKCIQTKNVTYFGSGKVVEYNISSQFNISASAKIYYRIVKNGCLYTSCLLRNNRSNNCFALLLDGTYVKIISFILDTESNIAITLCNKINIISCEQSSFLYKIVSFETDLYAVATENIDKICVYIDIRDNMYIAVVPNLLFY